MFRAWFNSDGVAGRADYACGAIIWGLLAPAMLFGGLKLLSLLAPPVGASALLLRGLAVAFLLLALAHSVISYVVVTVKRLRDLRQSGWWALLLLVPGVSWVLAFVVLSLVPGSSRRRAATPRPAPA